MRCFLSLMFLMIVVFFYGCLIKSSSCSRFDLTPPEKESLIKRAKGGDADAALRLADYYSFVEYDVEEIIKWYRIPSESGDRTAQFNLASFLDLKQREEAVYWYKKSARSGLHYSQKRLAALYETGTYVEKDYRKAKYWYEKAAFSGNVNAMIKISECYTQGLGGPRDIVKSYSWLLIAELITDRSSMTGKDVRNRKRYIADQLSMYDLNHAEEISEKMMKMVEKDPTK